MYLIYVPNYLNNFTQQNISREADISSSSRHVPNVPTLVTFPNFYPNCLDIHESEEVVLQHTELS